MQDHIKFLKQESEGLTGHYKKVAEQDVEQLVAISTSIQEYFAEWINVREHNPLTYILLEAEVDDAKQMEEDEAPGEDTSEGAPSEVLGLGQGIDDLDFGDFDGKSLPEIYHNYKTKRR